MFKNLRYVNGTFPIPKYLKMSDWPWSESAKYMLLINFNDHENVNQLFSRIKFKVPTSWQKCYVIILS